MCNRLRVMFMVFNPTFNNISWMSVLLVEKQITFIIITCIICKSKIILFTRFQNQNITLMIEWIMNVL